LPLADTHSVLASTYVAHLYAGRVLFTAAPKP
jgi:hypothetical protein